jgi:hypothetical protein
LIGRPAHDAVESVNFPHQMAFSEPSNGGVTGHCADSSESVRNEGRLGTHAGGGGGSFTASMTATDDHHVEPMCH